MADAKPTISQAKSVGDWVKAYLDDDANEMSKRDKFLHLQRVTQFGAFCYMIQNNSKQAHIDFFDSNYTHMDTDVAKAAEMVSRLIEIKYTNYPTPLSYSDVDTVNRVVGLFGGGRQPLTDVIREDYIKLAESFSEHIPQYPNPSDTANMMKALNKDMVDVQSDHTRLVHATASDKGALKRDDIYAIMDVATEKLAGIWKEAKDEKSSAEKALMKDSEDAVGKRIDLGIKTAKVGILGAGAVGCIGAVVGGLFWPALGLIPIFVLGKRWLPDFAKSIGGLYGNFKKRVADRYKIKKAQVKQDYIEKGPNALTKAQLMMLSPGDRIILDKQRKSFPYLYGKNSLREMTMDYLNLGKLESPLDVDNVVPADAKAIVENKIAALGATSTYDDLMQAAQMLKTFEGKIPDFDKVTIKQKYAENAAGVIERLVFDEKIGSLNSYQTNVQNYLLGENSEIKKLIESNPNVARKVRNFYAFADKEHVGMINPNQSLDDFVRTYPVSAAVSTGSITLNNAADTNAVNALAMIDGLTRGWGTGSSTYKNAEYSATVGGTQYGLEEIKSTIDSVANPDDKKTLEAALTAQMKHLFEADKKDYTIKAMEILRGDGTDGAKNDFVDLLKDIGEIKYEDLASGKVTELYAKILKTNPKTAAQPMDLYLITRLRLAMQELCVKKLDTLAVSSKLEIADIAEFLTTVNNSAYVDEFHKQDIMAKSMNLFSKYIDLHQTEFRNDLATTSTFLQNISKLNMLTDNQKNVIIDQVSKYLDPAIANKIYDLSFDFVTEYKNEDFRKFLEKNSTSGGLKDLFDRAIPGSPVADAKDTLTYLSELGKVKIGLNVGKGLNGQKIWAQDESRFMSTCFFFDASGAAIQRVPNDDLRKFIENDIGNIQISFKEVVGSAEKDKIVEDKISTSKAYEGLKNALDTVKTTMYASKRSSGDYDADRDSFAALILLKNKCVALFRESVKQFIKQEAMNAGVNESTWILQASNYNRLKLMIEGDAVAGVDGWKKLMEDIDYEIDQYIIKHPEFAKYQSSRTTDELVPFSTATDVLEAYQKQELTR